MSLEWFLHPSQKKEAAEWKEEQLSKNADSVFLQNLSFGSEYELEVMAVNTNGSSTSARFNFTIAERPCMSSLIHRLHLHVIISKKIIYLL